MKFAILSLWLIGVASVLAAQAASITGGIGLPASLLDLLGLGFEFTHIEILLTVCSFFRHSFRNDTQ